MSKRRTDESRTISLLAICVGVSSACFFANLPLVPLVLRDRDPEMLGMVGLLVAISFVISAVMSPVWGMLADRFGPRIMMQRAAILVAIAYIALAFAPTFEMMLAARIVNGLASGLIPAAYTYAVKALPRDVQGRGFTTLSAARSAGAIIGPGIAVLAGLVGPTGVMLAVGCIAATTAIFAAFLPRVPGKGRRSVSSTVADAAPPAPRRMVIQVAILSAAMLAFGAIASGLQTALPLSIAEVDPDASYVIAGSMFAIGGAVTLLLARPWGKIIDRQGEARSTLLASGGTLLALVLVLILVQAPVAAWALAGAYALYCAFSTQIGAISAIVNGSVTAASGLGQGIQNAMVQGAAALGPLLVGFFVGDLVIVYWAFVAFVILGGTLLLGVIRSSRKSDNRVEAVVE